MGQLLTGSSIYEKEPDKISGEDLQEYFLFRKNESKWAPNTLRICYCGIRFFYINVLKRDWHIFNILKAQKESRLPAVLSNEEVQRILNKVRTFHNRVFLSTTYACGLRLQEALYLQVSDIDSDRMMIHVHRGKGSKDPILIFPAPGRNCQQGSKSRKRHGHLPLQENQKP